VAVLRSLGCLGLALSLASVAVTTVTTTFKVNWDGHENEIYCFFFISKMTTTFEDKCKQNDKTSTVTCEMRDVRRTCDKRKKVVKTWKVKP